jgi:hypothetical protein
MEQIEALQTYHIEGFSEEEVNFTLEELENGTDKETIKDQLFLKFKLFDAVSENLIHELSEKSGILIVEEIDPEQSIQNNQKSTTNFKYIILGGTLIAGQYYNSLPFGFSDINFLGVLVGASIMIYGFYTTKF